jgi:hypothetical protein
MMLDHMLMQLGFPPAELFIFNTSKVQEINQPNKG